MTEIKSKNIYIIGMGVSGISAAKSLSELGHNIYIYDDNKKLNNISENLSNCEFIHYDYIKWKSLDYLVLSPGIPTKLPQAHPAIKYAIKHKVKITIDIELFSNLVPNASIIAITGTNGKSTTTALIEHIFKHNNYNVFMGGNIGKAVFELPIKNNKKTYYILELSSFQLELIDKARFNAAILLNFSEDHLDRHGNMTNYLAAKLKIFANQKENDLALINKDLADNNLIKSLDNEVNFFSADDSEFASDINLAKFGSNENLISAIEVAKFYNISANIIKESLKTFKSLPHRLEYLGEINNAIIYNDSKATNAESTKNALVKFSNICLILGGVAKSSGIKSLKNHLKNVSSIFLIGEAKNEFAKELDKFNYQNYHKASSLDEAFKKALHFAKNSSKKVTILLSPACGSFDMWKNFVERGNNFKKLFKEHKDGETL